MAKIAEKISTIWWGAVDTFRTCEENSRSAGHWKSSNAPIRSRSLSSCQDAGWWSAPSPGSPTADSTLKIIATAPSVPRRLSQRHQLRTFSIILPILEKARKKTRPREVDLYEVFWDVLYVFKSGCHRCHSPCPRRHIQLIFQSIT